MTPKVTCCEAPLHPSRIAVVGIALLSAVTFYFFSLQELPKFLQHYVLPLYSIQFAMTVLLFFIISRFDPSTQPSHQAIRFSHSCKAACDAKVSSAITHFGSTSEANADILSYSLVYPKCCDCGHMVLTFNTKHCSKCNKCIPGYDHHCIYLNTCIGTHNYPLLHYIMHACGEGKELQEQ
ncbi:zinc finger protein dhhc domain containing [Plasmopara halstedii]|uniref:Palmitoyltransferase n=1 Tax=Plasmopara halstedii TaxID=4781 RepID=A0A0N7L8F0_PLAHL|nr:zinc finger protein dhhc domain containing [Plasmopara halstedii]CEG49691.1 zinc finger protein dhhc domain containing [Plasmopara halstedii]|eukprot:XP_024586060.1 zinc finger protein dhhc domain containing [Plasmopara halstedii]